MDLYSGPEFEIHSKYIYIIIVISITMVYAPIMPIFVPLCFVSLFCLYIVERLAMAYAYSKPPMYSEEINILLLRILALLPFCFGFTALFAYSNQQVFRDQVQRITNLNFY